MEVLFIVCRMIRLSHGGNTKNISLFLATQENRYIPGQFTRREHLSKDSFT